MTIQEEQMAQEGNPERQSAFQLTDPGTDQETLLLNGVKLKLAKNLSAYKVTGKDLQGIDLKEPPAGVRFAVFQQLSEDCEYYDDHFLIEHHRILGHTSVNFQNLHHMPCRQYQYPYYCRAEVQEEYRSFIDRNACSAQKKKEILVWMLQEQLDDLSIHYDFHGLCSTLSWTMTFNGNTFDDIISHAEEVKQELSKRTTQLNINGADPNNYNRGDL